MVTKSTPPHQEKRWYLKWTYPSFNMDNNVYHYKGVVNVKANSAAHGQTSRMCKAVHGLHRKGM